MENISIHVNKKRSIPGQDQLKSESPFDRRSGFFGVVIEVQPKTNTVSIRSDTGRVYTGIRVASPQWVTMSDKNGQTKSKDKLTGKRHLPPVNTCIYCLMPTGEPSSAIVLCSIFAYQDPNHSYFKEDSEDAAFTEKLIDNGGWMFTHDMRTGTRRIKNHPVDGKETISLEIDQEEEGKNKTTLTIYENIFEIDEENKKVTATIKGDADVGVKGNANLKVDGDIVIESIKTGLLKIGNIIDTLGAMIGRYIDIMIGAQTIGSPVLHMMSPKTIAQLKALKAIWVKVFK
ncbi:hypothetical protein FACS1894137_05660 [Spirochaetia bacterium]|nr:hypothetical protein FACS1894137_05660 [Spirochaetia bacterium]